MTNNQFPSFNNAETSTFSFNAIAPRSSNVISDLSRYSAQHSNKSEHQLPETEMSSQQSKNTACAENQEGFTVCEFSSLNN